MHYIRACAWRKRRRRKERTRFIIVRTPSAHIHAYIRYNIISCIIMCYNGMYPHTHTHTQYIIYNIYVYTYIIKIKYSVAGRLQDDSGECYYFQSPRVRSDFAESFDCFQNVIKDARDVYNTILYIRKFCTPLRMLLHAVVWYCIQYIIMSYTILDTSKTSLFYHRSLPLKSVCENSAHNWVLSLLSYVSTMLLRGPRFKIFIFSYII